MFMASSRASFFYIWIRTCFRMFAEDNEANGGIWRWISKGQKLRKDGRRTFIYSKTIWDYFNANQNSMTSYSRNRTTFKSLKNFWKILKFDFVCIFCCCHLKQVFQIVWHVTNFCSEDFEGTIYKNFANLDKIGFLIVMWENSLVPALIGFQSIYLVQR